MIRCFAELQTGCRREFVLSYFGQPFDPPCGACDLCDAGRGEIPTRDEPFDVGTRSAQRGRGTLWRHGARDVSVLFDDVGYKSLALDIVQQGECSRRSRTRNTVQADRRHGRHRSGPVRSTRSRAGGRHATATCRRRRAPSSRRAARDDGIRPRRTSERSLRSREGACLAYRRCRIPAADRSQTPVPTAPSVPSPARHARAQHVKAGASGRCETTPCGRAGPLQIVSRPARSCGPHVTG